MRARERVKSESPTSSGSILYALGRQCSESGAEGAATHKGEQRWDHPWLQVIVSFVTLLCQSLKKVGGKAQLWLAQGQFKPKIYKCSHTKTPIGTSYHSRDQRRQIHHFAFKDMLNSDLFIVLPFICSYTLMQKLCYMCLCQNELAFFIDRHVQPSKKQSSSGMSSLHDYLQWSIIYLTCSNLFWHTLLQATRSFFITSVYIVLCNL